MPKIKKDHPKVVLYARVEKESLAYVEARMKQNKQTKSQFVNELIKEAKRQNL